MQYVYILQRAKDDSKYIDTTSDLRNRLEQHNKKTVRSTKSKVPYKIIWYCSFSQKERALEFEKYLKTGSGIAFYRKRFV